MAALIGFIDDNKALEVLSQRSLEPLGQPSRVEQDVVDNVSLLLTSQRPVGDRLLPPVEAYDPVSLQGLPKCATRFVYASACSGLKDDLPNGRFCTNHAAT